MKLFSLHYSLKHELWQNTEPKMQTTTGTAFKGFYFQNWQG